MMMLGWLLIPLLAIGGLAALLGWRPQAGGQPWGGTQPTPEEILRQRYARGEIDREEYERMREELRI